jgi:hypothetical protein
MTAATSPAIATLLQPDMSDHDYGKLAAPQLRHSPPD